MHTYKIFLLVIGISFLASCSRKKDTRIMVNESPKSKRELKREKKWEKLKEQGWSFDRGKEFKIRSQRCYRAAATQVIHSYAN